MLADLIRHEVADLDVDRSALSINCIPLHLGRLLCRTLYEAREVGLLILLMYHALDNAVDIEVGITPDGAREVAVIL